MGRVILGLELGGDSVTFTYITIPADIRETGLAQQHTIQIPLGGDYEDEVDALMEAAEALLEDALDDFERLPAYEPPGDDEEDDGDDT